METLNTAFKDIIKEVIRLSKSPDIVTGENVYQEADRNILPYLDQMIESVLLPGSRLSGLENLEELYTRALSGHSCLLLLEHYSNFDLSLFTYLARKAGGRGEQIANSIIAIAGMKLNEANPVVSAFASAYTRIVIYPSRSIKELEGEVRATEIARSNAINRAAMKALTDHKDKGRLVLIFPSGTRFRPWDPSSGRGVREVDSYIKSFDYMCLVAVNGNCLKVREGDMLDDVVEKDVVLLSAGPPLPCREFRDRIRAETEVASPGADKKQAVADAIMAELLKMHDEAEKIRSKNLG
ncbi:MAG: 1-acyl-sn-glycerol-3-phosphate acyltransferase [Treponema sp.]|nr:1-acyl-sn-glycerol-3-phosphate acyltransferase [Treponema sp.]